jgi:hypothetical protein
MFSRIFRYAALESPFDAGSSGIAKITPRVCALDRPERGLCFNGRAQPGVSQSGDAIDLEFRWLTDQEIDLVLQFTAFLAV